MIFNIQYAIWGAIMRAILEKVCLPVRCTDYFTVAFFNCQVHRTPKILKRKNNQKFLQKKKNSKKEKWKKKQNLQKKKQKTKQKTRNIKTTMHFVNVKFHT